MPPRVIDHTHTLAAGNPGFLPEDTMELSANSAPPGADWREHRLSLAEHFGTHLDAPSHFGGPGAPTIDQIEAERLVGTPVVVDVTAHAAADEDYRLRVDDLLDWENAHGRIPDDAIVIMYSGWQKRWDDPAAYRNMRHGVHHFPGFSAEAARWLLDNRGLLGVGVDTLSLDHGPSTQYPVHRILLGAGKWGLENLARLDEIPPGDGLMVVGPTKHRGGSGGPARVFTLCGTVA